MNDLAKLNAKKVSSCNKEINKFIEKLETILDIKISVSMQVKIEDMICREAAVSIFSFRD